MYKVKLDGRYLYHPWDAGLSITAGKLTQELNKNGIFDFSIPSCKERTSSSNSLICSFRF